MAHRLRGNRRLAVVLVAVVVVAVGCGTSAEVVEPARVDPLRVPGVVGDVIVVELPPTLAVPDVVPAAAAVAVVSELFAAWFFPPSPLSFAQLATATEHLTTAEWSADWAGAAGAVHDRTAEVRVIEIEATRATADAADVSVIIERDGEFTSLVFGVVNDDGWRVGSIR